MHRDVLLALVWLYHPPTCATRRTLCPPSLVEASGKHRNAMARFRQPSVTQIIAKVGANEGNLDTIDFSSQAVFQMKSTEKTQELCGALQANTTVKVVKLKDCAIDDAGAAMIGEMLAKNASITELDLSNNTAIKEVCVCRWAPHVPSPLFEGARVEN